MAHVGLLEDNAIIARLAATMLNHVGHTVTIYERPSMCLEALNLLDQRRLTPCFHSQLTLELPFELLILDLHLPEVGGLHILELLRAHAHTCKLPLVFCTAATERELDLAFRLAPHASLVEKPFKMETLVSAVSSALQSN